MVRIASFEDSAIRYEWLFWQKDFGQRERPLEQPARKLKELSPIITKREAPIGSLIQLC